MKFLPEAPDIDLGNMNHGLTGANRLAVGPSNRLLNSGNNALPGNSSVSVHFAFDFRRHGINFLSSFFSDLERSALSRNSTRGPFHAAFLKTTNSVLVTAMRCALSSR